MKKLTHYTSFINMLHIITSFKIRFGNMKYSNDKKEIENYEEESESYFTFCCCKEEFNALMWLAYSGRKNGASITFCFKEDADYKDLFTSKDIKSKYVSYRSDYHEEIENDNELIGKIKDKRYKSEAEYRYLLMPKKATDMISVFDINEKCLEKIIVRVDPYNKDIIENYIKSIDKKIPIEIAINDLVC